MYADDLVTLSPTAKGLKKLLNVCSQFGESNDIRYNSAKSSVLIFGNQKNVSNFWKAHSQFLVKIFKLMIITSIWDTYFILTLKMIWTLLDKQGSSMLREMSLLGNSLCVAKKLKECFSEVIVPVFTLDNCGGISPRKQREN